MKLLDTSQGERFDLGEIDFTLPSRAEAEPKQGRLERFFIGFGKIVSTIYGGYIATREFFRAVTQEEYHPNSKGHNRIPYRSGW